MRWERVGVKEEYVESLPAEDKYFCSFQAEKKEGTEDI